MCGIAGLFSTSPVTDAVLSKFAQVWSYQEIRGHDACGILALGVIGDKRHVYYSKFPVTCSKFVPFTLDVWRRHGFRPIYAIAHARAATHGPPEVNVNNHPITHVYADTLFAIVHNGVLSMNGMCTSKVSQTDTEELLCLIENTIRSGGELKEVYDKIRGSATFMAMHIDQSLELRRFVVGKYINPLDKIEVDGSVIFGSVIPTHIASSVTVKSGIYELISGYAYESNDGYYDYYKYVTYYTYNTYKPNDKKTAPAVTIVDDDDSVDVDTCFEDCLMSVADNFCSDYNIRELSNGEYELTCKRDGKAIITTARIADRRVIGSKHMTKALRRCMNECTRDRAIEAL
jgi:asparagine synthetase B (glutamine-hydrolysing)